MIIHRLIAQHLKHRDDPTFYAFQAEDAIQWIERAGVQAGPEKTALDLGCGHGIFGAELVKRGWKVTFADEERTLMPELASAPFRSFNIDRDDLGTLGSYDLVVCSNVLEHLAKPEAFIGSVHKMLNPKGKLYLSWTNWLSPWGGHEFSPFHYLGYHRGYQLFDKVSKAKRKHTPFQNLYPTYIGTVLKMIRRNENHVLVKAAPRYYTEFSFLVRIPLVREFLTWNCALLIGRR